MNPIIKIGSVEVALVDYAVGASAVLGIRDSGKTVTSKGIAEQLLEHQVPIVVFDAVGKWRWMKAAGEGKHGKAYKVVVAGGRAPDLPLTPHSVSEIVRAAMKHRIPLILDLFDKALSKADWRRIVQQAIHIIHYENEGGALHVFLEEAAEFVPQKVFDGETYAEVEKLVRMGGNASVGITLINQRSQEVNKAVLDNCSTALVLGCQVGKNAIEAVEKWIERLDPAIAEAVTKSLPKLQSGSAWVWTRKSLDQPSLERMPMCRSFHPDRRTPEAVLSKLEPTDTAQFVAKLADSIPKVIEEARANDPVLLKRQLAEAKRALKAVEEKAARIEALPAKSEIKVKEKAALKEGQLARCEKLAAMLDKIVERLGLPIDELVVALKLVAGANRQSPAPSPRASAPMRATESASAARALNVQRSTLNVQRSNREANGAHSMKDREEEFRLGGGLLEILKAAAQHPDGVTDEQISVLTGYRKTSRTTYKQKLLAAGYLVRGGRGYLASEEGIAALGSDYEPLPTGTALREHWLRKLSGGELALFQQFVTVYPGPLNNEQLIEATGYQKTSVVTYKQKLAARNLIVSTGPGEARASEELYD